MTDSHPSAVAVASQASRAIGAMFFCVFGGAWIALWARSAFESPGEAYAVIGIATLVFLSFIHATYQRHAPALQAQPQTPQRRRQSRNFHLVNVGRWVLLIVAGNVLANTGLAVWIIPTAIFIVGAHFIPLAMVFDYAPHYLTGLAMMLIAIAYPALAPSGAGSGVGCLGAGLALWGSAAWAITRRARIA